MKSQKELFSHAATVLTVANVEQSLDYYENKLGFTCYFKWNDPLDYAVLKRGKISNHLTNRDDCRGSRIPYAGV
jgi:catechol 2,3-dioxygenase-like lactoylglutathione lyase family enzyme